MNDHPRDERDEDASFREWAKNHTPQEHVPPSYAFLEMMRQAANQKQEAQAATSQGDVPQEGVQPAGDQQAGTPAFEDGTQAETFTSAPDPNLGGRGLMRRRRERVRDEKFTDSDFHAAAEWDAGQGQTPTNPVSPPAETANTSPQSAPETAQVVDQTAAPTSDSVAATDAPTPPPTTAQKRPPRQRERRKPTRISAAAGFIRSFILVFAAAGLMATIFTWWTPPRFISNTVSEQLSAAIETATATHAPTLAANAMVTPNHAIRIGIVSGHRGNDSGAVCPDGLTEAEINFNVARLVVAELQRIGYTVDLLDEFDPRLDNYQAAALVSIHANTCQNYGYEVSGYMIAAAAARITSRSVDDLLVECVARHYEGMSGLSRHAGTTVDMTDYHAFREIHPQTPAAILELGFMYSDRELLTGQPDLLSRAILEGVLCFVDPIRNAATPTPLPVGG